jgi:hypothetical protein
MFGDGTVTSLYRERGRDIAYVTFAQPFGVKRLLLGYANLTILTDEDDDPPAA